MDELFPFRQVLSFDPLIERWRALAHGEGARAAAAARIVEAVDAIPELHGPITDASVLERHAETVSLLMSALFPADAGGLVAAAFRPFDLNPFYATPGFEAENLGPALLQQLDDRSRKYRELLVYQYVLAMHYDAAIDIVIPFEITTRDPTTGLARHFRVSPDTRHCRVALVGQRPELSVKRIQELLENRLDLELWASSLPADSFELHGLAVMQFTDITAQRVLSDLTSDLLRPDAMATTEAVDRLRARLRCLLRRPDVELGLIRVERDDDDAITGAVAVGRSILLSEGSVPECPNKAHSLYTQVAERRQPFVAHDLSAIENPTRFEHHVLQQGLRNIMVAPLEIGDRLVGLIELASPQPGTLHLLNTGHIQEALGLFAIAMQRSVDELETRVQAVIKQQYTAIHPAVEWRFRRAARNFIDTAGTGQYARPEPIVFPDVYPLYGLSDIRSSSLHRSEAIQADLLTQLDLARDVVGAANRTRSLPVLAELDHRIETYREGVAQGLRAGDEVRVLDFLGEELDDVLRQVAPFGEAVAAAVDRYREALDPDLGFVYRRRRDFEESVTLINDTIGAFIDREQERAQAMFPHYFERFKTDGIDYNIYVGASLQEDGGFEPIFLRNLRLWQLMTMCSIVWELRSIENRLTVPLEVAHLVLVHSAPLSIRFRTDEKRFDVDGAYNIRYEIVKKRIDKARVRDTRQPLTLPGRIAIVYSHPREADEYREYIDFLHATGFITGEVEALELEDLQGASGLQALRITVAASRDAGPDRPGTPGIPDIVDRMVRSLES